MAKKQGRTLFFCLEWVQERDYGDIALCDLDKFEQAVLDVAKIFGEIAKDESQLKMRA